MADRCLGEHRFFVSEVKGSAADKEVWVVMVCTCCGDARRVLIPLDPTKPITTILGGKL